MERALVLEIVRVTEAAALAASSFVGKGDKNAVDGAGTQAMREVLNQLELDGRVVIGEGEMDEAPMLFIGEEVGTRTPGLLQVDIAVDPVEGTTVTARGLPNGVAVIAMSERGGLLGAPDMYMEKLVVGPPAVGRVHLESQVEENLKAIASSLERDIEDLVIVVLDRQRHEPLISRIRGAGARVKLIGDGDVIAALAVAVRGTGVHALMGSGGAPEGVLTAAAMKCLGGEIQGRFLPANVAELERCKNMGVDVAKIYNTTDLAPGSQIVFSATGITDGELLQGVRRFGHGARTHSIVTGYATRQVRFIDTVHLLEALERFEAGRQSRPGNARLIAFSNQKGGVGKTTTTANLGYALVERGKKVLLIDCDPQANLTVGLGLAQVPANRSLAFVLANPGRFVTEVLQSTGTPGLDIVPSHLELAEVDQMLTGRFGGHNTLRNAISPEVLNHYDYVLFDSPPNFGQLTYNVLCAAQEVVIPVATHFYALQGLTSLLTRIIQVQKEANPKLSVLGLLATRYDSRVLLCRDVVAQLPKHGEQVFVTVINEASKAAEAPAWGQTVIQYQPDGQSANQHRRLAAEIELGFGQFDPGDEPEKVIQHG